MGKWKASETCVSAQSTFAADTCTVQEFASAARNRSASMGHACHISQAGEGSALPSAPCNRAPRAISLIRQWQKSLPKTSHLFKGSRKPLPFVPHGNTFPSRISASQNGQNALDRKKCESPALRSKFAFSPLTTFEILAIPIPLPGGRHMILLDRRPAVKQDPASRQKKEPMSSSKSRPERRASRQLEFRSTGFITSRRQKIPAQAPVFCERRHYQARRPPARNPATRRPWTIHLAAPRGTGRRDAKPTVQASPIRYRTSAKAALRKRTAQGLRHCSTLSTPISLYGTSTKSVVTIKPHLTLAYRPQTPARDIPKVLTQCMYELSTAIADLRTAERNVGDSVISWPCQWKR
jgi:hypothetical protein